MHRQRGVNDLEDPVGCVTLNFTMSESVVRFSYNHQKEFCQEFDKINIDEKKIKYKLFIYFKIILILN